MAGEAVSFFDGAFHALTGNDAFPWQRELFRRLIAGEKVRACNLPTGLGKTAVIPIWLTALAYAHAKETGVRIPRRLVYVVNRRTVVDQSTREAERIRDRLRGMDNAPHSDRPALQELRRILAALCATDDKEVLAISTLRGQYADNQEWSADPSRPAVICGTVDMIGSRLLFSGYRIGFRSRPLHAGFLGQDALLVHDEAHLEPAFQELVESIEREQHEHERTGELPWPKLRVMQLTATTRNEVLQAEKSEQKPLELTDEERNVPGEIPEPRDDEPPIHRVWRRLQAKKRLAFRQVGDAKDAVAKEIAELAADYKDCNAAVLVFVRTLDDIQTVEKELVKTKREVVLLTGTMRGRERDELIEKPEFRRFFKDGGQGSTVYLVCTSAGEVGIDMSADHMVCDLSTFESMAQRLGRVHRYGEPTHHVARIDVVHPASFGKIDKKTGELNADEIDKRRQRTLDLLRMLPQIEAEGDNGNPLYDASPTALMDLRQRSDLPCKIEDAFAPTPATLVATDILFDAWAMTTIREQMPGRPEVAPYLHGLAEWEPFQTHVAWREEVEVLEHEGLRERYKPADVLDDYPLKPHELLRDATDRKGSGVFVQLSKIAARHPDAPVWVVDSRAEVRPMTLQAMINSGNALLHDATVLLPPRVGGLSKSGMLDGNADYDNSLRYDVADEWFEDARKTVRRRVRIWSDDRDFQSKREGKRLIRRLDFPADEEDADAEDRAWHWYELPRAADNEGSQSAQEVVKYDDHVNRVTEIAARIVTALALPRSLCDAVILAAKFHDLGKRREVWQRSIGNPNPTTWYAKSGRDPQDGKSWKPLEITSYRHELGSLLDVQGELEFRTLSEEMQQLVLHLIAASHGRARPHFPADEAFGPARPQRDADALAAEVPRTFGRLQRKLGRWGLAYLESLLRAADWAASSEPSEYLTDSNEVSR